MEKTIKIGEIETEMIGDIGVDDILNVFLRIGWGAETTTRIEFKPAEALKAGDGVKIVIEKVYQEPESEPAEAAGEAKAEGEVPAAEAAPAGETEAAGSEEKK